MQVMEKRPARKFLTAQDVADQLGFHVETVKEMLKTGKIPGRKLGNQWRIHPEEFDNFMRGTDQPPQGESRA